MKLVMMIVGFLVSAQFASAEPKVGSPAPAFEVADATGKTRSLSEFKGQNVVLEWFNKDCPYVVKHYKSGNMQKVQAELTGKGYTWLTVISSAKDKQGYVTAEQALKDAQERNAKPTAILLDPSGVMGKAYQAKTTPHMFIIDKAGILQYAGAIDDNSSSDPSVIAKSENYVLAAAASLSAGKAVAKASTKPYGCSVKY